MKKFLLFISGIGLVFTLSACAQESKTEELIGLWKRESSFKDESYSSNLYYQIKKQDSTYFVYNWGMSKKNPLQDTEVEKVEEWIKNNPKKTSGFYVYKQTAREKEDGVICVDSFECFQLVGEKLVDQSADEFIRVK